jgi:hypothetical protein
MHDANIQHKHGARIGYLDRDILMPNACVDSSHLETKDGERKS